MGCRGLKYGDKVKVTRNAKSRERGWSECWVDKMDKAVGTIQTVEKSYGDAGVTLVDDSYLYPWFVLEVVH